MKIQRVVKSRGKVCSGYTTGVFKCFCKLLGLDLFRHGNRKSLSVPVFCSLWVNHDFNSNHRFVFITCALFFGLKSLSEVGKGHKEK